MEKGNAQKEKTFPRKGFIAIIVLAIASFGLYNLVLEFLKYLGLL